MRRNPGNPQRKTEANAKRTQERVEQYYGKVALLNTWEAQPDKVQIANHDYLLELRRTVRNVRNYLIHRADASIKLFRG